MATRVIAARPCTVLCARSIVCGGSCARLAHDTSTANLFRLDPRFSPGGPFAKPASGLAQCARLYYNGRMKLGVAAATAGLSAAMTIAAVAVGAYVVALFSTSVFVVALARDPRFIALPVVLFAAALYVVPDVQVAVSLVAQASVSDYVFPCAAAALFLWRRPSSSPWPGVAALLLGSAWLYAGVRKPDEPLPWLCACVAVWFALTELRP